MWPRVVELMLGLWLLISPLVFRVPAGQTLVLASALVCAAVAVIASLASFWRPLRHARFATLAAGLWLVISAEVQARPLLPPEQNQIVVGLLLVMFAIIPGEASQPPLPWRAPRSGA